MEHIDLNAVLRMSLVYMHLISMCLAAAAVAFGDFAIFSKPGRINAFMLEKSAHYVSTTLIALWISGLLITWVDTRFDLALLAAKPKLLAKLCVVIVLTLNGWALHRMVFPRLAKPQRNPMQAAILPAVLGAVSGTTWMFAAFVGVGKPLASALGYAGFMGLYGLALALGVGFALTFVRPRLAQQMSGQSPLSSSLRTASVSSAHHADDLRTAS